MKNILSRRNFLRGAGGAVSLSWGGLRIFAGPPNAAGEAPPQTISPSSQPFIYGAAFYRPPNPPASMRRGMLKDIAQKYQFNIVRIYPAWVYYHPAADRFAFDDLEEVMKYCDEFGLRVLMGIVTEEAPYWLERAHPETRYVDAKGNPQRLSDSSNNVSGGWPGLCLDWEPVQEAAQRFIRELIKVVAPHPSMYAYDCWNEAHIEPAWARNIWAQPQELLYCYCDQTIAKFRRWLEHRYGNLDALNEAWVRHYSDWKEVDPPRAISTYTDWVDWRDYIIGRTTWELQFRVEAISAADPHHLRECHSGTVPPVGSVTTTAYNGWRLAECVQAWGLSTFPRWSNIPPSLGAARFEVTRSQAAGKPFWMTELQGGHGSGGLVQSGHMRPRDIRLWNWLGVAAGAKGILYWAYHTEATGTEAMGFGLVDRDGSETDRVREAARNNRLIQAHWDILQDYQPKPQVALLTDQDNAILTYAMSGKEDASVFSFQGYYKALWNMDQWVDFIEPRSLGQARYKVVIAPWHLIGKKETCQQLLRYVENGGTLILETSFGLFDERCFHNPVIPPWGLAEAFGYREKENYYMRPRAEAGSAATPPAEMINYEPDIQFSSPVRVQVRANTYLTPIEITSATPIATCMGLTVAAKKQVGKGEVYYLGTNVGASIAMGNDAGIDLLRAIITPAAPPAVSSTKLRPRLIEGPKRSLLAVFNDTPRDQTAGIGLPRRYHRATDIHSRRIQTWKYGVVQVSVPYEDVIVLLLE
jgi:beta-galactosidase